jgi:ABC-type bacteriocin/lantibiotic exporter with double-glycine peptidase domain
MSAGQRNNGSLKGHRPFGRGGRPGGHGGHGSHGRMPVERAKDFKGTLKRLLKLLKPYRVKLFAVLILAALSTVFSIVSPKIMGLVTTELFEGVIVSGAGVDFSYIAHILIILGGALSYKRILQLFTAIYYGGCCTKHRLQNAQRYQRKTGQAAPQVL